MSSLLNTFLCRHFVKIIITKISQPFFCHLHRPCKVYWKICHYTQTGPAKPSDHPVTKYPIQDTDCALTCYPRHFILNLVLGHRELVDVFCLTPALVTLVRGPGLFLLPTCL